MILTHSDITKDIVENCDACVIGSGAGGAVVAKELAEAGLSVILLEEGGYHQTPEFNSPNALDLFKKLYRNGGGTVAVGSPSVIYVEGRCVGGSTTVNGGTCWRTPDKILKRWQWEKGLNEFTPLRMEPFFKRVEEMVSVQPILPIAHNRDAEIFRRGAQKLGYEVHDNLRNHRGCVGTNQCITGCPTGGKQSTLVTYIPAFIKAGGRLYANCKVSKVKMKDGRATGVRATIIDPETKKPKAKVKIRSQITVVCCGAIHSPSLLMKSGLPDKSKQLGRNLLLHPNVKVMGVFDEPVKGWQGVNQGCQITEFADEGILMALNFIPPMIFPLAFPFYGPGMLEKMRDIFNHCVIGGALIEDTVGGRVVNLPWKMGPMSFYQLCQQDFQKALRATALLAEVFFAAGARSVHLPFVPLHEIHTIDEIRKIFELPLKPSDVELMTVHMMGTCQMGDNPKTSVVNTYGESHQIKGLFVADASVFPTSIGVNPQITIMSLATRTAFHIIENQNRYLTKR